MSASTGTIIKDGERATILFERRLPFPIEAVWEAITDPKQIAVWLGSAKIEGREGGTITIEAGPVSIPVEVRRMTGRILAWAPPNLIEYEWRQAIVEESTVRFELTRDGDGTILKLTHRWLSVRNAGGFAPGWHAYLDRLTAHLEGGAIPDWSASYENAKSLYS
jgi:uncharacterized protein YndB with AHSA1/START domain